MLSGPLSVNSYVIIDSYVFSNGALEFTLSPRNFTSSGILQVHQHTKSNQIILFIPLKFASATLPLSGTRNFK